MVFMVLTGHISGIRKDWSPGLNVDADQRLPFTAECNRKSDVVCGVPPRHRDTWNIVRSLLASGDVEASERVEPDCSGFCVKGPIIISRRLWSDADVQADSSYCKKVQLREATRKV